TTCGGSRSPTSWSSTRRRQTGASTRKRTCTSSSILRFGCRTACSPGRGGRRARACSPQTPCPRTRPPSCRRSRCRLSRVPAIDPAAFVARFGHPIEREAHAFGRVNLIGEHTDYNDGFVLPTSIPQATAVAIARRADRHATIHSVTLDATTAFEVGRETPTRGWVDYVQGVTQALAR